eukprot:m.41013 g.41013  ORF g.41013 m.41013 type:complete len:1109 (+) comp6027_c0_seq1:48-3374(+)
MSQPQPQPGAPANLVVDAAPHRMLKSPQKNTPKPPGRRPTTEAKMGLKAIGTAAAPTEPLSEGAIDQADDKSAEEQSTEQTTASSKSGPKPSTLFRISKKLSMRRTKNNDGGIRAAAKRAVEKVAAAEADTSAEAAPETAEYKAPRRSNVTRFGNRGTLKKLRRSLRRSREAVASDQTAYLGATEIAALLGELGLKDEGERNSLARTIVEENTGKPDGQLSPFDFANAVLQYSEQADERNKARRKGRKRGKSVGGDVIRPRLSLSKIANLREAFNLSAMDGDGDNETLSETGDVISGVGEQKYGDYSREYQGEEMTRRRSSIAIDQTTFKALMAEMDELRETNTQLQDTIEAKTHEFKAQLAEAQAEAQAYLDQSDNMVSTVQSEVKTLRAHNKQLTQAKDSLELEVAELQRALAAADASHQHAHRQHHSRELEDLRDDKMRLEALNEDLSRQVSELKHNELMHRKRNNLDSSAELEKAAQTIVTLREELNRAVVDLDELHYLRQSNEELRSQLEERSHNITPVDMLTNCETLESAISKSSSVAVADIAIQTDDVPQYSRQTSRRLSMESDISLVERQSISVSGRRTSFSNDGRRTKSVDMATMFEKRAADSALPGRSETAKAADEGQSGNKQVTSLYTTTMQQKKEIDQLKDRLKQDTATLKADNQRLMLDVDRARGHVESLEQMVLELKAEVKQREEFCESQQSIMARMAEPLHKINSKIAELLTSNESLSHKITARGGEIITVGPTSMVSVTAPTEQLEELAELQRRMRDRFNRVLAPDSAEAREAALEELDAMLTNQGKMLNKCLAPSASPSTSRKVSRQGSEPCIPEPTNFAPLATVPVASGPLEQPEFDDMSGPRHKRGSLEIYLMPHSKAHDHTLPALSEDNDGDEEVEQGTEASRERCDSPAPEPESNRHLKRAMEIGRMLEAELNDFDFENANNFKVLADVLEAKTAALEHRYNEEKRTEMTEEDPHFENVRTKTPPPRESLQWDMFGAFNSSSEECGTDITLELTSSEDVARASSPAPNTTRSSGEGRMIFMPPPKDAVGRTSPGRVSPCPPGDGNESSRPVARPVAKRPVAVRPTATKPTSLQKSAIRNSSKAKKTK